MRIQLESPKSSGRTDFTPGIDEDILMEDEIVAASPDEDEIVIETDQGTITPKEETLADVGITTSEELIKRLKSKDGVGSEGRSKIEIASAASFDTHVPIPKKFFLIADWLLDSIVKNARDLPNYKLIDLKMDRKVLAELFVEDQYWIVLERCIARLEPADIVLIANRYPLPPLLLSYVYFWRENSSKEIAERRIKLGNGDMLLNFFRAMKGARTSKQVYQLDSLNQCLASWLENSPLFSPEMLYCLQNDEKSIIPFVGQNSEFLELALSLWLVESSKPTNAKKVCDFFLAELLPLHSTAMWWTQSALQLDLISASTTLLDRCRAIICRISFQSIVVASNQASDTPQAVLNAVSEHRLTGALNFLSTYLSQLCLHRKDTRSSKSSLSWTKDGEWREEVLLTFIAPAIDLLISPTGESTMLDAEEEEHEIMTSLHMLLSTAHRWSLHYSDEDHSWRKILEKVMDFVLVQHARKEIPTSSAADERTFSIACMKTLIAVHDLDESIFKGERRIRAIHFTLDESEYEKGGLLDLLCSASIKSRGVVSFVESCQDALERAVLVSTKINSDETISERIIRTCLFKEEVWQHHLGVAVQDFVSVDDVMQLLDSILARLEKCCSGVWKLFESKKRKDDEDSNVKFPDRPFSLAIVQNYFASALLVHLVVPRSAYNRAQEYISTLQTNVIQKHLQWTFAKGADRKSDALVAALLKLHDSTQHLALVCGNEEQEQGSTWSSLATQWDMDLCAHREHLSYMVTSTYKHSLELRIRALLSVFQLIGRATGRQLSTPFDSLLTGSTGIALYDTDVFADLCDSFLAGSSFDMFTIPQLHGDIKNGVKRPAAWSLIVSPFLPIFERNASNELLDSVAFLLVSLIKPGKLTRAWEHQAWELLLSNSSNLELPRWREALCGELRKEIAELGDEKATERINLLNLFSTDWLPADLREILPEEEPAKMHDQRGEEMAGLNLRVIALRFDLQQKPDSDFRSAEFVLATLSRAATPSEYDEVLAEVLKALDVGGQGKRKIGLDMTKVDSEHLNTTLAKHGSKVVLQTIAILFCNSPEGTLLVSQRYLSTIVSSLVTLISKEDKGNRTKETSSNEEKEASSYTNSLASIRFIETVLSAKSILFRSADISAVFTICAEVLVTRCSIIPSMSSQKRTFFTCICTTLIECIRLRRDYVSQHLPQLMMLLVKLIEAFQGAVKSKGGSSQGREELLGLDQAKLFNRLLSTVTAKSTSASIGGLPESKMKSLAKSFSTHAPYVIVAYVRNMTASTTFARGEIREELTRGIYDLCDIIGPWQKNVMMDMLADEGERIVMRSLWRGWEAQRYRGA